MVVNYWHRKSGFYEGEPGMFHRLPRSPDFTRVVWMAIPTLQYDETLRAYWVPLSEEHEFEKLVLDRKIAAPCGRCQRGEPCTAWESDPTEGPSPHRTVRGTNFDWIVSDEPNPSKPGFDFDAFVHEFYRQINEDIASQFRVDPVVQTTNRPSGFQATYGRRVDPQPDFEQQRQERLRRLREEREREVRERREREARERAAREPAIQQPPDVRAKAARLLGVGLLADEQEIKRAVHRLAMEHHPDRGGDSSKMAEVLEARDVMLGKSRTRRRM